jgi:aminoglycoside phosphotransferase (APT) family kinase protein
VDWRWRLKGCAHRLRQVHGDFHPWNILFQSGANFVVLDRSRGELGDPADDITALTINYLLFSLQQCGRLEGPFATLFSRFWQRYLRATGDDELHESLDRSLLFAGSSSPVPSGIRNSLRAFVGGS